MRYATPLPWPPQVRTQPVDSDAYVEKIDRLHAHQDSRCALCGLHMPRSRVGQRYSLATIDHVIPKSWGGGLGWGNIVLAHRGCNQAKSDRRPTGCELIWLLAVNAREGVGAVRW